MKKLALIVVVLILLVVGAAIVAPQFLASDQIKAIVTEKVQAATGKTLTIKGEIHITLFPVAAVSMQDVTFSNPADDTPLATLKSLDVGVAVLPLLHKQIDITKLTLEAPVINLHVDKQGVGNWQSSTPKAAAPEVVKEEKSSGSPLAMLQNFSLSGMKISNGALSYRNEATGERMELVKLNTELSLGGIASPLRLSGNAEWNGKQVSVKAEAGSAQSLFEHSKTSLKAEVKSELLSFSADGTLSGETYAGKINLESLSVKSLLAWAMPSEKSASLPTPLALKIDGNAECSSAGCDFTNASFKLDKNEIKGNVKAVFSGAVPQIDANLTADSRIDVSPYLSPEKQANADFGIISNALAEPAQGWSNEPMDLSALRKVNADISLKVAGLLIHKITLGPTTLHSKLRAGHLNMDADADLYDGKAHVTTSVDASAVPVIEKKITLQHVQIEPLLKDAEAMDRLSGALDMEASLTTHGDSQRAMVESLAGNGRASLNNGVLKGINLADMFHNIASSFIPGASSGAQKTDISKLDGTFTIAQGILSNNDLAMQSPGLHVSGQGKVDLPARTVNYRLTPQLESAAKTPGSAAKEGVAVPVIVEGNFDHLSFRPDLGNVLQNALKNPKQFQEQLKNSGKSLGTTKDSVKNLKNLLKGL